MDSASNLHSINAGKPGVAQFNSNSVEDHDLEKEDSRQVDSEAQSVLEAIEVGGSQHSLHDEGKDEDLEKATTRGSRTSQGPIERIKTAQDWIGPDDPGNPMNWSAWKKMRHVIPTALLAFAVTIGSSMVSPANEDIMRQFGVSRTAAILPLTLFVIGLGMGPMISAPLSENFGRSMIYKTTPVAYLLFLIGAGFSKSFGGVLVCRLLAGAAGSPVLAVGTGTNADLFTARNRAVAAALYLVAPFLGPALGPVIGGFCAQYKGYPWTQWCTIFIGILAWLSCMTMEETYKKVILTRRAKKLNLPPPPSPQVSGFGYVRLLFTMTVARPLSMLVKEPTVLAFSSYTAFTFSVLFSYFAAYPYTFTKVYHFNTWQNGLPFLAIGVGVLLAAMVCVFIDKYVYKRKHEAALQRGQLQLPPEERLYGAMLGAFGLPIGLFWFAWTARSDIHWISPVLVGIPFAFGNTALFISTVLYLVDVYGPLGGASAMAANGLLRYTLGGVFPLWTVQMYTKLGIGWATSLLGFVCVALLPIPFVFYKFGPYIRSKSKMAP